MTTETQEPKKMTPVQEVSTSLAKMEDKFAMALPPQINKAKFTRVAINAVQHNKDLLAANRQSLYTACLLAAQDGLLPDGKEAALVVFGDKVAYMPMVGGILKKVRNSGELASITSQIIHKNDKFRYWVDGDGEHLEHEPLLFGAERGEAIGVYALAKTKDGAVYIEVMDKTAVDAVKNVARSKNIWNSAFGFEMWRKSAIRRLSKRLPMSTDLEQVIQRDDDFYDLDGKAADERPAEPTRPTRLSKIIDAQATVIDEPPAAVQPDPVEAAMPSSKTVSGQIASVKVTDSKPDSKKKWRRYSFQITGSWYSTFDSNIGDQLVSACDAKETVRVTYDERQDGDKTYFNIVSVSADDGGDVTDAEVPI